jgi:hypothetical protein
MKVSNNRSKTPREFSAASVSKADLRSLPANKSAPIVAPAIPGDPKRPVLSPAPLAGNEPREPIAPGPVGFRPAKYSDDYRIKVLVSYNPKKPGSIAAAKFPIYSTVSTVRELIEAFKAATFLPANSRNAKRARKAINYDASRGYIELIPPTAKAK